MLASAPMNQPAEPAPPPDLTDAAAFRYWTPVSLRFSDQDSMGHINNVAFAAYVEAGRVAFGNALLLPAALSDIDFMVVRIAIDYRRQMHYPGTVDVGTRTLRLGNSSMTLGHGLFFEGRAMATAESVLVFVDTESGASTPIPEGVRAALAQDQPVTR